MSVETEPSPNEPVAEVPAEPALDAADAAALGAAPQGRRRTWVTILKAAVVLSLIAWLLASGSIKFGDVLRALSSAAWWSSAVPLAFCALLIVSLRWWVLLRAEDIDVSLGAAVRLCLIGHFWNNVLPGAVTGDLVKMYYVGARAHGRRTEAWTTVLLDRVIGLAALVAISFGAALGNINFIFEHPELARTFWAMVACLAAFFVGGGALLIGVGRRTSIAEAVRNRIPFLDSVRRGYHTLLRFGQARRAIAVTLAMSFVSHGLLVLIALTSGHALGESGLTAGQYFFLAPIGMFINSVPIGSPGGAGVGESAFDRLFGWAGAPLTGAGIMLLLRIAQLTLAPVGALLYVLDKRARAAQPPATK